jgi:hypothetical protein
MNGDVTGRPTGSPLASHPANRTGPNASAHASIPASSDLARPLALDRNARRYWGRPVGSRAECVGADYELVGLVVQLDRIAHHVAHHVTEDDTDGVTAAEFQRRAQPDDRWRLNPRTKAGRAPLEETGTRVVTVQEMLEKNKVED